MSFQVSALAADRFAHLYGLREEELRGAGVLTMTADAPNAFPCRVSLADAEPGDRLLLLNYEHQPAETPFRSRHAIFVRDGAAEARPGAGEVPAVLARRLLSIRSFGADGLMIDGDVAEGAAAAGQFARMLAAPGAAYLHVHSARRGCYLARVEPRP